MTVPTPAELRHWISRNINLLEDNASEAAREHWGELEADYQAELACWQSMLALLPPATGRFSGAKRDQAVSM